MAPSWRLDEVVVPAATLGANTIPVGPSAELIVTQVFGTDVTAIYVDTGIQKAVSRHR